MCVISVNRRVYMYTHRYLSKAHIHLYMHIQVHLISRTTLLTELEVCNLIFLALFFFPQKSFGVFFGFFS